MADRPLECNFFPGLLEGLLGSLGIAAPGEDNPPTSSREGAGRAWSTAVCQAISWIKQKKIEVPGTMGLPISLDLCHEEDFLRKRRYRIPPVFSHQLFIPKMAKEVFKVAKPPVMLRALPPASSREVLSSSPQPEDGRLKPEASKLGEPASSTSQTPQQAQVLTSGASDTDAGKADEPFSEEEQHRRGLKVKLPLSLLKCSHKATASSSKDGATPSKVQKELEAEGTGTSTWTGPSEAALWEARFELYKKDLPEVQEVRARILGLAKAEEVTQEVLDSSPDFCLRRAADESCPPTVIGEHWIDHLEDKGHIATCKPHDFQFEDEWLPLYTRAGVTRYVSSLSSLLKTQGDSLTCYFSLTESM